MKKAEREKPIQVTQMIKKEILLDEKSYDGDVEWSVQNGKIICYNPNDDYNVLEINMADWDQLVKYVEEKRKKEKK